MKSIPFFILMFSMFCLVGCDTFRQVTNSTGTGFSLNGNWELVSNTPEQTLMGSIVTVASFVSEGKLTSISNNSQCYRENDVKWKDIQAQTNGSFTINNLLSNCNSGDLNYQPAVIEVINADEIRLTGKNVAGKDNVQTWKRVK